MRIELPASPLPAAALRAARRTRSRTGGFALPEEAEEQEGTASAPTMAPGLAAAGCLLAADSIGRPGDAGAGQADRDALADNAAAGQGRALLGALAGLQMAALGKGGVQARQTLADLARALPQAADPRLDEVLRAIAQRAAIELARAG